jgi:hypothetical protein
MNPDAVPRVRSRKLDVLDTVLRGFRGKITLEPEQLIRRAESLTGLRDWGDQSFRKPLEVLAQSYGDDAQLVFTTRLLVQRSLVKRLANRLQIQQTLHLSPQILETPISEPVFICGLPRSGTTFLHRLLAQDPSFRTLQFWELNTPAPPPEKKTYETDARLISQRRWFRIWRRILYTRSGLERILSIHRTEPDLPEECWPLFQNAFFSSVFFLYDHVRGYHDWLLQLNMLPAYEYYRRQLQILTCSNGGDLLLKHPDHLRCLGALFETFPDARILWIHRDVLECLPSSCSLAAHLRSLRGRPLDPREIGEIRSEQAYRNLKEALEAREARSEGSFLDVSFKDLVERPMEAVRSVYRFLGKRLEEPVERRMHEWIDVRRKRRKRSHRYSLEQFGLERAEVQARLEFYTARFIAQ